MLFIAAAFIQLSHPDRRSSPSSSHFPLRQCFREILALFLGCFEDRWKDRRSSCGSPCCIQLFSSFDVKASRVLSCRKKISFSRRDPPRTPEPRSIVYPAFAVLLWRRRTRSRGWPKLLSSPLKIFSRRFFCKSVLVIS